MKQHPRLFALIRDVDELNDVIAYGIALPDGTAVAVSWPARNGSSIYSSDTAEECAAFRGADLLWIGEP